MMWFSFRVKREVQYDKINEAGEETGEQTNFLSEVKIRGADSSAIVRQQLIKWKIATGILGFFSTLLLFLLAFTDRKSLRLAGSLNGYSTDFIGARSHIQTEKKTWIGAPMVHDSGEFFVPHPATEFSGPPRPELDEAWNNLTVSTYIRITESEAKATWGDEYENFWDEERRGYVVGLEMFHTLHCLNRIRRSLSPDYYQFNGYEQFNDENHAIHREHCIQQIRQYIMCAGDVTPLTTRYTPSTGHNYVYSDATHTCRNFDLLKGWADSRHHGELEVPPYERDPRI